MNLPSSMYIDHHVPTDLSEKIFDYMKSYPNNAVRAYLIAVHYGVTTQQIVSEVMHDKRLVHKFMPNQEYYIELTKFGVGECYTDLIGKRDVDRQ